MQLNSVYQPKRQTTVSYEVRAVIIIHVRQICLSAVSVQAAHWSVKLSW